MLEIGRSARRRSSSAEPELQGVDDRPSEALLKREHVADCPVVSLRPQVVVGRCVDQTRRDPKGLSRPPHATFEDVSSRRARARSSRRPSTST